MLAFPGLRRWNGWANSTVFATLETSDGQPEKALAAFQHVLETEVTWLRRIAGHPAPNVRQWDNPSMDLCRVYLAETTELAAAIDEASLDAEFSYQNSRGDTFTDRAGEALTHMLLHSSQYRGEAAGFLNAAGHRVPDLDLVFWRRAGEPE